VRGAGVTAWAASLARLTCAVALCAGSTSCASTTLRSGKPPGEPAPGYDDRWHSAFFFGSLPSRRSYDLHRLCPEGWSQIRLRPDPFTVISSVVTLFIYSPTRLTIICATTHGERPPPLPTYGETSHD
jgi:hypothetical protein